MKNMLKRYFTSCPHALRREILKEFEYVNGVVLDVGCGKGGPAKMLSEKCNYIIGVDISNVFDKSKISANLDFLQADALSLPFRDESFDAAVSFDVIEHVQNDLKFLREIRRVLKRGGKLLLETPNRNRLSLKLKSLVKPIKYSMILGPNCIHLREYMEEELEEKLMIVGFKNIRIRGVWLGLRGRF
jgi:ubiquinone/menaquinone biosynthesis C-methylase UbiE